MGWHVWTDESVNFLLEQRKKGVSLSDIATKLDKTLASVTAKWGKVRNAEALVPVITKRKYKKRRKAYAAPELGASYAAAPEKNQTQRPLMALVGSPTEVTQAIRELFS